MQAEKEAQDRDYLSAMSCQLLLRAGRARLGGRTRVLAAMGRVRMVAVDICKELEMMEQSLEEGGGWWKEKEAAEKEFLAASKNAKKVRTRFPRTTAG